MSNYSSPEEMKQNSISKMGPELGLIFHELKQELMRIFILWGEYCCLYGKSDSRVELLNKSAAGFFGLAQNVMWQQSLLSIARITDRAKTAGKENLTVKLFLDSIILETQLHERVSKLIHDCDENTSFCRDWRNRKIAHNDIGLFTDIHAEPLEKGSRLKVRAALESIAVVMNLIQSHYMDSETAYDFLLDDNDSLGLLICLDDGQKMMEHKKVLKRQGEYKHPYFKYSFE